MFSTKLQGEEFFLTKNWIFVRTTLWVRYPGDFTPTTDIKTQGLEGGKQKSMAECKWESRLRLNGLVKHMRSTERLLLTRLLSHCWALPRELGGTQRFHMMTREVPEFWIQILEKVQKWFIRWGKVWGIRMPDLKPWGLAGALAWAWAWGPEETGYRNWLGECMTCDGGHVQLYNCKHNHHSKFLALNT